MVDMSVMADMKYKPSLYDVNKLLDVNIVGEQHSRMSLFTNWILASKYCMLSGSSRSGKTWIVNNVRELVGDTVYKMTQGSDKSGWYEAQKISECSHVIVPELNQLVPEMMEVLKTWGEGKNAEYNAVILEAGQGGKRSIKKLILPYRPFVFSIADENDYKIPPELRYRLTEIRTDSSVQQNELILKRQAELATMPKNTRELDANQLSQIKAHIQTLPPFESFIFKHPSAELFVDAIPKIFTDCRTVFPIYLDNTYGIVRFHWKDRIIGNIGGKKTIFTLPTDMWLNHFIFGKTLIDSSLKCNIIERTIIEILSEDEKIEAKHIQKHLRNRSFNLSIQVVQKHLITLENVGYIEKVQRPDQSPVFKASDFFSDFKFDVNWNKVIKVSIENMEKHFPEHVEEYKSMCKHTHVINPFNGEDIDILNYDSSKYEEKKSPHRVSKITSSRKDSLHSYEEEVVE